MQLKLKSKIVIGIMLILVFLRMAFPIKFRQHISYDNLYQVFTLLILAVGIVFLIETKTTRKDKKEKIKTKLENNKKVEKEHIHEINRNRSIIILSIILIIIIGTIGYINRYQNNGNFLPLEDNKNLSDKKLKNIFDGIELKEEKERGDIFEDMKLKEAKDK